MMQDTTRDIWRALVEGEELVDDEGDSVKFEEGGELVWRKRGHNTWRLVDEVGYLVSFPLRRPPPEPATFQDAIPHILVGEMVKCGQDGVPFSLARVACGEPMLRDQNLKPIHVTDTMLRSTEWLVCQGRRWVSAKAEVAP